MAVFDQRAWLFWASVHNRFPKPSHGVRLPPRKPSKFLAFAGEWPNSKAIRELGNTPRFPTIPGNCCAEVVLGFKFSGPKLWLQLPFDYSCG